MKVSLANPEGRLPWPGVPGRVVKGDEIIDIDPANPFWSQCLADGTFVEVSDQLAVPEPEPTLNPAQKTAPKE